MNLTGKCKQDFEAWFNKGVTDNSYGTYLLGRFYGLPISMQFGVIQDFADSVGIDVYVFRIDHSTCCFTIYQFNNDHDPFSGNFQTRQESQQAAIAKFNEIYNER